MKTITKKQKGAIAGGVAVIIGSLTPLAVIQLSPVPDYVDPFFAGHPVVTNSLIVLTNRTYTVGYDPATMNPEWVAYRLHYAGGGAAPKRPSKFRKDKRLNPSLEHGDYTGTGFDRGHMAPSYGIAVCYGKGGQRETFIMSNVVPQTPGMNRGPWRKLEEEIAKDWAQDGLVWVITGPIYEDNPQTIGPGIEVPDACWKVLIRQLSTNGSLETLAFIVPQRVLMKDSYTNFVTSVDEVEKVTGIDFFAQLPDDVEGIIEAEAVLWD